MIDQNEPIYKEMAEIVDRMVRRAAGLCAADDDTEGAVKDFRVFIDTKWNDQSDISSADFGEALVAAVIDATGGLLTGDDEFPTQFDQTVREFTERLATVPVTAERAKIACDFYGFVQDEDYEGVVRMLGELDGTICMCAAQPLGRTVFPTPEGYHHPNCNLWDPKAHGPNELNEGDEGTGV